jgi:hypothetical protein
VTELLQELGDRVKALGADWTKYSVVGSFALYVVGYLALRFHLTALGVGTDLAVLDERYLFTGARFVVYVVSLAPGILLIGLVAWLVAWIVGLAVPAGVRSRMHVPMARPRTLTLFGIVFAVAAIQFVMRQCFFFTDLLLAPGLPPAPSWLATLLIHDELMPLYFSGLVVLAAVPLAILAATRDAGPLNGVWARRLLVFLAVVTVLLLPINYGILVVDKTMPRVTMVGDTPLADGDNAWLVWEGKEGVTYLVQAGPTRRRSLVTVQRAKVTRTEIVGTDRILPLLFGGKSGAR